MASVTGTNTHRTVRLLLGALGVLGLVACFLLVTVHVPSSVVESTPGPAGALVPTRRTESDQPVPEALASVLVGASLVLLVLAAFFDRVARIEAPGGVSVELSDDDQQGASDAVSQKMKGGASKLKAMACSTDAAAPQDADEAAAEFAQRSSAATLATLKQGRELFRLAARSPDEALRRAVALGVPEDVARSTVLAQRGSPELWNALAAHAIEGTESPPPTSK